LNSPQSLEDGDLLHIDASGHAHVFNALALTASTIAARDDVTSLRVVREHRVIEAEVESIMKVGGRASGPGI
jgi:hypothetical protein